MTSIRALQTATHRNAVRCGKNFGPCMALIGLQDLTGFFAAEWHIFKHEATAGNKGLWWLLLVEQCSEFIARVMQKTNISSTGNLVGGLSKTQHCCTESERRGRLLIQSDIILYVKGDLLPIKPKGFLRPLDRRFLGAIAQRDPRHLQSLETNSALVFKMAALAVAMPPRNGWTILICHFVVTFSSTF